MIRVLLVDDNRIIRTCTKQLLIRKGLVSVIGECSDGQEVIPFLNNNKVDVILMDIKMKFTGGIEATRKVKEQYPEVKVIAFSSYNDSLFKSQMVSAGAVGYILKGVRVEIIMELIKSVMVEEEII